MSTSRTALLLLSAALLFSTTAFPAAAEEGGVIIPQVDPHVEEGYVDVYYHDCPVTGSDPCDHHYVGRVGPFPVPCVDPDHSVSPDRVHVANCGQTLVDEPICVPSATPSASTTSISFTINTCSGTISQSYCLPAPTYSTSDLWVRYKRPDCSTSTYEPSGPWAEVESRGNGEYEINYWNECDYRLGTPNCDWWPNISLCVKAQITTSPTLGYAVGQCYGAITGSQCIPSATPSASSTEVGITATCGTTTVSQSYCLPAPTYSTSDLWVRYRRPDCSTSTYEPAGPWAEVENRGNGEYEINYWNECDYRLGTPNCDWWPNISLCVKAQAQPDVGNRRATVTAGQCYGAITHTVEAPCLHTDAGVDSDARGVWYDLGPCTAPLTGHHRADDLPEVPGPWVQVGSGGKYPATLWVEIYTSCVYDLDDPLSPTCSGNPLVLDLGPFP